jgi:hypothetical protein
MRQQQRGHACAPPTVGWAVTLQDIALFALVCVAFWILRVIAFQSRTFTLEVAVVAARHAREHFGSSFDMTPVDVRL